MTIGERCDVRDCSRRSTLVVQMTHRKGYRREVCAECGHRLVSKLTQRMGLPDGRKAYLEWCDQVGQRPDPWWQ